MIPLFISWRYILQIRNEKSIATMLKISFFSIFIGSFSLALIISIMKGFESAVHEKMQNIHPQIIIQSNNDFLNEEAIYKVINEEFTEIESFAPTNFQYVLLSNSNNQYDLNNIGIIKGIDPIQEEKVSNIQKKLTLTINKEKKLINLLKDNDVIIGEKLAKALNLSLLDKLILLIPQKIDRNKLTFDKYETKITGFFTTGIDEFDQKIILSTLSFLNQITPEVGISLIGLKLKSLKKEEEVIKKLRERLKLTVQSWKDLDPALISSLKLEKYVMGFIFLLIALIAGMNIVSVLYMIITFKNRDIAILKTIGIQPRNLKLIFLNLGLFITTAGNILGLLSAFFFGLLIQRFPFIELPDVYYTTHLPIQMQFHTFLLIFFFVTLIGLFASWIPIRKLSSLNIIKHLKQD